MQWQAFCFGLMGTLR